MGDRCVDFVMVGAAKAACTPQRKMWVGSHSMCVLHVCVARGATTPNYLLEQRIPIPCQSMARQPRLTRLPTACFVCTLLHGCSR